MEERKLREKELHNTLFSEDIRKHSFVEKIYQANRPGRSYYRKYLEEHCPGKKVLEYGCGQDGQALFMARCGATVTGIDISEVGIEKSRLRAEREQVEGVHFQVMDAEALEFGDDSFDLICGVAILHHLDLNRAYAEIARTLRPDGSAVFLECLGHNPAINLYRKLTPHLRTPDEHPLLMKDLRGAHAHFGSVQTHFFDLLTLMALPLGTSRVGALAGKALAGADALMFRLLPFMRRYGWVVVVVLSAPQKKELKQAV